MPVQDSDAERRNLLVTSLAFIVYYTAGGNFIDNEVRLVLANLKFGEAEILAYFAWAALFWFALRYWQTHRQSYIQQLITDVRTYSLPSIAAWYITKSTGLLHDTDGGFYEQKFNKTHNNLIVEYTNIKQRTTVADGTARYKNGKKTSVKVSGYLGLLCEITVYARIAINGTAFTSYTAPYLLFIAAVIIPTYKYREWAWFELLDSLTFIFG